MKYLDVNNFLLLLKQDFLNQKLKIKNYGI